MRPWIPLLLIVAGVAAHANGLWGEFLYDDRSSILPEPAIRSLWPPWSAAWAKTDSSYAGRPIPTLSLAINYALVGFDVRGWHAFNIALHVLCGLTLFGVVRRTLRGEWLREQTGAWADGFAATVALLWLVHPVQTVTVAYVTSRTESIMGLFYLLTLYCAIRARDTNRPARWNVAAVACCMLGMASKEAMVTAPVMVACYDACFRAGTLKETWRTRRGLYAALASTWVLLAVIVISGPRTKSVGFHHGVSAFEYASNQCLIVLHYLRLCFFPYPLNFDYGFVHHVPLGALMLPALALAALVAATIWALVRVPPIGFLGAWFFGILAPTSSIVPIVTEVGSERRLYLPLAAVIALSALGVRWLLQRAVPGPDRRRWLAAALVGLLATGGAWASARRNFDYRSRLSIWRSALRVTPDNPQAQFGYGNALNALGRRDEAGAHYQEAVRLKPDHWEAHANLAAVRLAQSRVNEAISQFEEALRIKPDLPAVHQNLALVYQQQGRLREASASFREAIRLDPNWAEPLRGLAVLLATTPDRRQRDPAEAVRLAQRAMELGDPIDDRFPTALSLAYEAAGRREDAIELAREALDRAVANGHPRQDELRARLTRLTRSGGGRAGGG